jgi:predicted RNA-binding Zn ribbon-like protein
METVEEPETALLPPGIRELPIVGGHLALDFANTVDDPFGPQHFDHVADYRGLVAWARRVGIVSDPSATALLRMARENPRRAASAVRRAASLRTALNETFGALVEGRPPEAGWERLRPFVTAALRRARLAPSGHPELTSAWDLSDLQSPLWPVAEAAYRLLTGPELERLKRCAGCPWLFLDQSRNGSRRWCSMEVCGTHEKIRRYVTRRAERRAG